MYRPGAYTEVRLPCVPDTDSDGVTTIKYTVGKDRLIITMFITCSDIQSLVMITSLIMSQKLILHFQFSS